MWEPLRFCKKGLKMGSLTIRNIDNSLKVKLRMVAAMNERSMEEEARQILKQFLLQDRCSKGIGSRISKRFSAVGGVVIPEISRSSPRLLSNLASDSVK
jgi:plasmid stability protein